MSTPIYFTLTKGYKGKSNYLSSAKIRGKVKSEFNVKSFEEKIKKVKNVSSAAEKANILSYRSVENENDKLEVIKADRLLHELSAPIIKKKEKANLIAKIKSLKDLLLSKESLTQNEKSRLTKLAEIIENLT